MTVFFKQSFAEPLTKFFLFLMVVLLLSPSLTWIYFTYSDLRVGAPLRQAAL